MVFSFLARGIALHKQQPIKASNTPFFQLQQEFLGVEDQQ
jgi:hypothetical protein